MINEAVRIIDSALRDATIGLAVKLALVARESGDALPTTPTIYNEMQHGEAARDTLPDAATHVILIGSGLFDERTPLVKPVQDKTIEIAIRGILRNTDTPAALRTVSYVMLALQQTLGALTTTAAGEALRTRNSVGLINASQITGGITSTPADDTPVTWQLRCTCNMRPPA